jgi:hypothetical protein
MSTRGARDRSYTRPQRGLTMGGNVYSEEAQRREAEDMQYERGRNRLASETFLARLRAEHGPEPRFDLRPSCKNKPLTVRTTTGDAVRRGPNVT